MWISFQQIYVLHRILYDLFQRSLTLRWHSCMSDPFVETYFYLFLFSSVMSRFQALHSLVKKLSNANSHSDIRKYGHAIVSQIGSSKDRRKRITSEEMRAIIEEKDAAITLVKIIMKIIHLSFCDKEFWKFFGHEASSCISIYHLKFLSFEGMSR